MTEIVRSTRIARPPDDVWVALADFGALSRWAPNVAHSCLTTHQHDGIGTVRRVQAGRNALLEEVIRWEPGARLAYTIEGLPPVVRSATNSWTLEGSDASTTVSLTTVVDAGPRPPQRLAARAVGRVLGSASDEMLAGLKAHLEKVTA